jgi:hypothetical protein
LEVVFGMCEGARRRVVAGRGLDPLALVALQEEAVGPHMGLEHHEADRV